jgi:hypothetical protein
VEIPGVISLPRRRTDPIEIDLAHVEAAIALVLRGGAVRVRLVGLTDPESLAPVALARAQASGVGFSVDRDPRAWTLTIGPRSADR